MLTLRADEIAHAISGTLLKGSADIKVSSASTDTRNISHGDIFFALAGERFDAHEFLGDIPSDFCNIIVASQPEKVSSAFGGSLIVVSDTLAAYQNLAAYVRRRIAPKVIAVTGSVGKTSLKDMIGCICLKKYKTAYTEMNYNNEVGVPMTILSMPENTEVLVLEMGMDRAGQIRRLAEIARPDIAVIGNIGLSHRENFDSDDGIFNAKMEITAFLAEEGTLIINADDERLAQIQSLPNFSYGLLTAGERLGCDFVARNIEYGSDTELAFDITHAGEETHFLIPAAGRYNGVTAAMAVAAAWKLGIVPGEAAEALRSLRRTPHRLDLIEGAGIKFIDDAYNASPSSMASALDYLMAASGHRKIAVLAGMNELGDDSLSLHRAVGENAARVGVDILMAVGEQALPIADGAESAADAGVPSVYRFPDNAAAAAFLAEAKRDGDVVLVKGSRSMKAEELIDLLIGGDDV